MSSIGVRDLTVLGEFKPFGLTAEASDGKPPENEPENYGYFLFDSEVTRERDDLSFFSPDPDFCSDPPPSDSSDHELFIRGNRIIWSVGSRVHKRYTAPNTVLMACWCRMASISSALLCVLQSDTLAIYSASGEVVCIPLPCAIAHVSSLPFGLLLLKSMDGNRPMSSSSSLLNSRDLSRPIKDYGNSQYTSNQLNSFEPTVKEDDATICSHLILKHPSEEPQATYFEDRGNMSIMKDFEEKTIWTSDILPLMVSYHKGKMQHSIWLIEIMTNCEAVSSTSVADSIPNENHNGRFSFRRIWQGKCSHSAASKVFLSVDNDGVPVICFLLLEQKLVLAVRLLIDEGNDEVLIDIRPHMTWNIPAISASPVVVTRPRVKIGLLPFTDIIVLGSENCLLLYSGKQCLCKYLLPDSLAKSLLNKHSQEFSNMCYGLKITGVDNAVEGRININVNNGQVFRCALRRHPSSSLANDCIAAMSEGLHSSFYDHFAILLWGDGESAYLSNTDSHVDSEWDSFSTAVMKICKRYASSPPNHSTMSETAWNFLLNSKFHMNYRKQALCFGVSLPLEVSSPGCDFTTVYRQNEQNPEVSFYAQLLRETLDSLHAVYENLKLDNLRKRDLGILVSLLCNIAASLGEPEYVDYYIRDFPSVAREVHSFHSSVSPRTPPSLFRWLENCLLRGYDSVTLNDIPLLVSRNKCYVVSWARKIVSFYSLLLGAERIGRKLSSGVCCCIAKGSASTPEELTVLAMVAERFGRKQLDLLPIGVSLPLCHALDKCRESPPTDWPAAAYVLIGREDLAMACLGSLSTERYSENKVNLVSISIPYMLHLQPVTMPSSVSDVSRLDNVKSEQPELVDDGMEQIFNSSTQLRYGCDLRLNEVRRLMCSAKPVAIQTSVSPSASDQDLQQHQLWNLAQRTTALPFGRGAFTLATTYTLLTEALVIPKLVLAGRLPAQQNATVNLDPNIRNISEIRSWPEFHNGVAAGLRLAPFQGKMSRTWILYNKPIEPNFTHAGLLLALGLHDHLRVLTVTDVYSYLAQEHDITTVGVMLGMAASHRGTMHPAISKILYLHIPSRHLSAYPELELPTNLQSAALMAIGLLHEGSAHPLTMKVLLGEIGRRSGGDNVLEREGYAVAAGCALGLVALGKGGDAFGSVDSFVDRLFQYTGSKGVYNEKSSHIGQTADDHNRSIGQMDGTQINVDVTAPGATIALALIFLKTESEVIASRLHIPMTHFDLQYVRPDFIMLRIIARNLIMWNRVCPSTDWVESQVPEIMKVGILKVGDAANDNDDFDSEAIVQAYVNIVAGACISLGLKYAGTKNADTQELLYNYAVYFLNEIKHIFAASKIELPKGLLQYVDRGTLEICLHLIVLSLSLVMAGSGHLQTFRLLRYLRARSSTEGNINYGTQMAVSLAIGFLFLGGGMQTFSTGNSAIAALLITLYPRLPTGPNDNRCHLQAFRHLYVIAAEPRWVQTVDVDTGLPVYAPLEVTIKETDHYAETSFCEVTPCILPERSVLKSVQVCGPRYWPQVISLVPEDKPWWRSNAKNDPFNSGLLYIKRKVGSCSYVEDPVGCQSLLSRAMHKIYDASPLNSPTRTGNNFDLCSFKLEQLVSTFSADPSLIAFSQLFCDSNWNNRYDSNFQDFCSQVLFECVSKDRPALLQVYLSLYTMVGSMWEQVNNSHPVYQDSCFLSSLKLALAYNEAVVSGKLTCTKGGIIQSTFLEAIREHREEILSYSQRLKIDFSNYLNSGDWPNGKKIDSMILSWYLQLYDVPPTRVIKTIADRIKEKVPMQLSAVPLLHLLLPTTHIRALTEIDKALFST